MREAIKKGTGLIYVSAPFSLGGYYLWNGSSQYGSYPTAKLAPNTWQLGKIKYN